MAERATIIDNCGDVYSIELFEDEEFFAMRVYREGIQVGFARCLIENDQVELAEIRVQGRLERKNFINKLIRPFNKFRATNYQSRGIGSKLLKEIVAFSSEIGSKRIYGSLMGEKDLLAKWYDRHGFEVDMTSERISMWLSQ